MYGLDLFSGIGGITKALEGYVTPVAYCENDRYAQGVLLSRMATRDLPIAPIWDDITTLDGRSFKNIDIIYGGFPCQDISVAGRGAGLAGERSGLFFEIVRLIGEIRPRFVFLENVPAIRTRGASVVVGELDRLWYDSRFDLISAAEVGSQIAEGWRWFIMAKARTYGRITTPLHAYTNNESKRVSRKKRSGFRHLLKQDDGGKVWCFPDTCIKRGFDDVSVWMERLSAIGNAVVPAQAREAFERLMGLK
jgi:DNA (cytosine-5)-methyltransferase 1